jgi:uncharacterized membrane protein
VLDRTGVAVPLLAVLAFVVRLPNLGESVWYDEVWYAASRAGSSLSDLWSDFLMQPPAPLYGVVMYVWVRVFGDGEIAVRVPSLIFGIASIGLTYRIAGRYGSPRVALLAAAFLCVSPVHVWYSQEATPYAMTLVFLLASVLAWFRVREDPRRPARYAAYGGALLVTVFTHYFTVLFLLPLTLLSLGLDASSRRRVVAVHASVVACLAVALGIKVHFGLLRTGQGFLRPFTPFEWWMLLFHWFLQGNALWTVSPYRASPAYLLAEPLFLACQACFAVLFLRGIVSSRAQPRRAVELVVLTSAVPIAMLLLTHAGYRQLYIERYLVVLLPFFAIVLARGAASFGDGRAALACAAAMGVIAAASYGAWLHKSETWTVYKQNPDWRAAARYLGDAAASRDAVIVTTGLQAELDYYLPRQPNASALRVVRYDGTALESLLADDGVRALYLVTNHFWRSEADEVVRWLRGQTRVELTATRSFKGLEVHTFRQRHHS